MEQRGYWTSHLFWPYTYNYISLYMYICIYIYIYNDTIYYIYIYSYIVYIYIYTHIIYTYMGHIHLDHLFPWNMHLSRGPSEKTALSFHGDQRFLGWAPKIRLECIDIAIIFLIFIFLIFPMDNIDIWIIQMTLAEKLYPLVSVYLAIENHHLYWKTHYF